MEKVKLQQKTYLWNLLLVVLGGVLTIAGGIANTERLSHLESKKQEYIRFHQIYYFLLSKNDSSQHHIMLQQMQTSRYAHQGYYPPQRL